MSYTSYFDNTKGVSKPIMGYLLGVNTNMDNILKALNWFTL
jgi:hypothetical protein